MLFATKADKTSVPGGEVVEIMERKPVTILLCDNSILPPCRGAGHLKHCLQCSYFVIVTKKKAISHPSRTAISSRNDDSPVCSSDPRCSNSESCRQQLSLPERQSGSRAAQEGQPPAQSRHGIKGRLTQSTGRACASDVSCFKADGPTAAGVEVTIRVADAAGSSLP